MHPFTDLKPDNCPIPPPRFILCDLHLHLDGGGTSSVFPRTAASAESFRSITAGL
jgi:hypothetical protein